MMILVMETLLQEFLQHVSWTGSQGHALVLVKDNNLFYKVGAFATLFPQILTPADPFRLNLAQAKPKP